MIRVRVRVRVVRAKAVRKGLIVYLLPLLLTLSLPPTLI